MAPPRHAMTIAAITIMGGRISKTMAPPRHASRAGVCAGMRIDGRPCAVDGHVNVRWVSMRRCAYVRAGRRARVWACRRARVWACRRACVWACRRARVWACRRANARGHVWKICIETRQLRWPETSTPTAYMHLLKQVDNHVYTHRLHASPKTS